MNFTQRALIDPLAVGGGSGGSNELAKIKADGGVGYTEEVRLEVLPTTTVVVAPMEELGGMCAAMITNVTLREELKSVEKAMVSWNGTLYECNAYFASGIMHVGNFGFNGGDDTGEPFFISYIEDETQVGGLVLSVEEGEYTVSVVVNVPEIHPIESKYIPLIEGVLPVVSAGSIELSSAVINELSTVTNYMLDSISVFTPIILTFENNSRKYACLMSPVRKSNDFTSITYRYEGLLLNLDTGILDGPLLYAPTMGHWQIIIKPFGE